MTETETEKSLEHQLLETALQLDEARHERDVLALKLKSAENLLQSERTLRGMDATMVREMVLYLNPNAKTFCAYTLAELLQQHIPKKAA